MATRLRIVFLRAVTAAVALCLLIEVSATPLSAQAITSQSAVGSFEQNTGTDIKGALEDSLRLLMMQHLLRIAAQPKTRAELGGRFFADYHQSVRMPQHWGDGDAGITNYFGHPSLGAITGFIWLDHAPSAPRSFELSRRYWTSRLGAFPWMMGYSVQFEIGPLSEVSIGNVGLNRDTTGWTDYVMTPVGGLFWIAGEDALDRFVIGKLEDRIRSRYVRAPVRMILNPARSAANLAAMQAPWHRDGRPLVE